MTQHWTTPRELRAEVERRLSLRKLPKDIPSSHPAFQVDRPRRMRRREILLASLPLPPLPKINDLVRATEAACRSYNTLEFFDTLRSLNLDLPYAPHYMARLPPPQRQHYLGRLQYWAKVITNQIHPETDPAHPAYTICQANTFAQRLDENIIAPSPLRPFWQLRRTYRPLTCLVHIFHLERAPYLELLGEKVIAFPATLVDPRTGGASMQSLPGIAQGPNAEHLPSNSEGLLHFFTSDVLDHLPTDTEWEDALNDDAVF